MRNLIIAAFLIITLGKIQSQVNLVPNPSFENIDTCCFYNAGVWYGFVPPWNSPNGSTPDLFNTCTPYSICHVPNSSTWGYQWPHTGSGFIGEAYFLYSPSGTREYMQVKLDTNLVAGKSYCVSYYVSLANRGDLATSYFGTYFSDTAIHNNTGQRLTEVPQVNVTMLVTDTANWVRIAGSFTATGGERYMIIGNFKDDATTLANSAMYNDNLQQVAYYLIDDVDVHEINLVTDSCCVCDTSSNIGVGEIIRNEELIIAPNPSGGVLTISTTEKIKEIKVYNVLGECLLTQQLTTNNLQLTLDVSSYTNGLYFIEVTTEKGIVRKKIIKQ